MNALPTHRLERWEYDLGRGLLRAFIDDDRHGFDQALGEHGGNRPEIHTDLIAIFLRIAETRRWKYPFVHTRPSERTRTDFFDALSASEFADLIDVELIGVIIDRLYQRAFREPVIPSSDLISMTSCLAVAAWRLWESRRFPRDPHARCDAAYRGAAASMRWFRLRTYEWIRQTSETD